MKRELKEDLSLTVLDERQKVAAPIPMKRELKVAILPPPLCPRAQSCSAHPDEKGTERKTVVRAWLVPSEVAAPIPMKRELKGIRVRRF